MKSSQCPQPNSQTVDLRNSVIKLEKLKKNNTSNEIDDDLGSNFALKTLDVSSESSTNESLILEISDESDTEIDVENNTILTDAEMDNNNNTVNETMDAPEDNTANDSNTVHNYFKLKKQMRDKILAKRLMSRRKYLSRPSLNQSSLLDYFGKSKLPFKRIKSEPKTPSSGYFTRSKNSSYSVQKDDYIANLNLANSTLISESSPVSVTTSSVAPEVPVNAKHPELKDCIIKYCLKCNETFKIDKRLKYCGKCRLMLKYKCVLCEGIYGTQESSYGHLSKHSKTNSKHDLSEMYSTVNDSDIDNTANGIENSLSNEEAALNDTTRVKHYNYICMDCNQAYESTTRCKECQALCRIRCIYCDKTYNSVSGVKKHIRQVHNVLHLPPNKSGNASAIETSQNMENTSSSRKRKMTTNVSEADIVKDFEDLSSSRKRKIATNVREADIVKDFEDLSSSRKRKIVNDGSMIDTSNNVIDKSRLRKRITVNNDGAVTVAKNITKNDERIKNSKSQNSAFNVTEVNDVEELDVKTCVFLNCLKCNLSIQKHDGNIIPCNICNVNMVMKCYLCNDYVNTADEVKNHIRTHMANNGDCITCLKCSRLIPKSYIPAHLPFCKRQEVLFSCKICNYKTTNEHRLIDHALKRHAEYINLNQYNGSLYTVLDDSDIEKQRKSSSSGKRGMKRKNLTSIKGRKNRRGIIYQCDVCSYNSKFSNNLSRHIISKHLNDSGCNVIKLINETYNADLNGNKDSAFGVPRAHENTSLIYRYCPMCKKLEKDYDTKYDNNKKCENCKCLMKYKCIKCEKLYNYYSSILYHMNSKCSIQRLYTCSRCQYTTPIHYHINKHLKIHDNELAKKTREVRSTEIQTPEDHQNIGATSQATLKKSKKTCPKCNSRITAESYHHQFCGKEPTILCKLCPFKTKYKSNLLNHCKAAHSSDKKVKVSSNNLKNNETPNKDVKNISQPLQLHISSAEMDKYMEEYCVNCCGIPQTSVMKPTWKCKKCKINLLFRCTKCNVMYPKRELLVRHVKRHLNNTYRCTNCTKNFGIFENLKKHQIICKSAKTN